MDVLALRQEYHQRICREIIRVMSDKKTKESYPNFADVGSSASRQIAWEIAKCLKYTPTPGDVSGQTCGDRFEAITRDFLAASFPLLSHLRPGNWLYQTDLPISHFDQYEHLADLERIVKENSDLASALGRDYIIKPDIVIGRHAVSDAEINEGGVVLPSSAAVAQLTALRRQNFPKAKLILHASISCKWTLRSDRGQNARTEALNLIRNRKGRLPHILAVTAEPLPMRIAALALGTGDLDCVYHFALPELQAAVESTKNEDQADMLRMLLEGRRLRDIADLPFDLAV
jgi:hypothetical protein